MFGTWGVLTGIRNLFTRVHDLVVGRRSVFLLDLDNNVYFYILHRGSIKVLLFAHLHAFV